MENQNQNIAIINSYNGIDYERLNINLSIKKFLSREENLYQRNFFTGMKM